MQLTDFATISPEVVMLVRTLSVANEAFLPYVYSERIYLELDLSEWQVPERSPALHALAGMIEMTRVL